MSRLFWIIFLICSSAAHCQLQEPLIGPEYSTGKKENFSGFLGENKLALITADYIYYSKRKHELIIRKFHRGDLQLIDSKDIYSKILDGFTNEPKEIFYQHDSLFLFSKLYSERDKTELLALEVFDALSLNRIAYSIIDTLKNGEAEYIEEASDKNGFLIASHERFTNLVEQEIKLVRIDGTGSVSWKKVIKSPMALQSLRIENIKFNSDSPIFILCNYAFDFDSDIMNNQLINNNYAIWAYDHDKKFLKEFGVRLKSKWINGVKMALNNTGHLVLSGYFNTTKKRTISGVFSLKISDQLNTISSHLSSFGEKLYQKFPLDQNKVLTELSEFEIRQLEVMENGSFFVLGEHYYKYIERTYDPRTNITTTTEYYKYNSIITSYFDARGNYKWTERIPKAQSSTNDYGYFSSYCVMNDGENLYLFFNDSKKNNEEEPKDYFSYNPVFNNRRSQISYVHLTTDGVKRRAGLLDPKFDYLLRAKLSRQISDNSIYLITETNRDSKIIRVSVKEEN